MKHKRRTTNLFAIALLLLMALLLPAMPQVSGVSRAWPDAEVTATPEAMGSINTILSDGQFVYGPNVGDFTIDRYLHTTAPHLLPYSNGLFFWSLYPSINPKVLFTLIELSTGLVTSAAATEEQLESPLNFAEVGFDKQLELVSKALTSAYYWHLRDYTPRPIQDRLPLQIPLLDGTTWSLSPATNAATFALANTWAQIATASEMPTFLDNTHPAGFCQTYLQLFPDDDPLDESNKIDIFSSPPSDLFQFPYPVGDSWSFNGVHDWAGNNGGSDMSSIDFSDGWPGWGVDTSDMWVVAAAPGDVEKKSDCWVAVHHDDGWSTWYYHLENVQKASGSVSRDERLANLANTWEEATCSDGDSDGPHVHFTLRKNGALVAINGTALSGWVIHSGRYPYDTDCDYMYLERTGQKKCAFQTVYNDGVPSPPSCPPESCIPGNEVERDFFGEVVERLADVPLSDFAVDALVLWEPHENTLACWNPLATTWRMEVVCDFNPVGVQHYQSQDMGTQATANTLAQGYYDNIRRMLRLEEFNREGLRADLGTWGTCSGSSCNSLLDEWKALWDARGSAVDVYFLVDLSGSFSDDLPVFKAQAPDIISNLRASNPNTRFGLGKYEDYPIPQFGSAAAGDKAYERLVDLTFDTDLVLNTISGLFTRDGWDSPQSQLPALFQAATGAGQDLSGVGFPGANIPSGQQANFRDGATKLFLLWTDASFHQPGDPGDIPYPGPSFEETRDAILALDPPLVLGISSGGGGVSDLEEIAAATNALAPAGGVDCDGDGIVDVAEGEPLVCGIASSGAGIGEAVTALVEAAADLPIADAGGPYTGGVGDTITFDGSGSFDPDGTIVLYEWDFESDGVFDLSSVNPTATHVYPTEFSGTVTLRVTDNDGGTGTDTAAVEVQAPPKGDVYLPLIMKNYPPDTTPPAAVSNLATSNPTLNSITLSWTAPGDDGNTGTAWKYDVRYSTSPITEANWNAAAQCVGEPAPQPAGNSETFTVNGLSPGTTYYFALKTADKVPNWSGLSNVASRATLRPDTTPPAAVTNLATSNPTLDSMTLNWTAPGDDGNTGTASEYDIRHSTSPITDANWDAAAQCAGEPAPRSAGSNETFTVNGLTPNTTYYFALKAADDVPNWSGLSNVASRATLRPCDALIVNGGFEWDEAWVFGETPRPAAYTTDEAHWEARSARLGIKPPTTDAYSWSSMRQRITIPGNAKSATLSFWYKPFSEAPCWSSWQQLDWDDYSVDQPSRILSNENPLSWASCDWQQALILTDDWPNPNILATVMNISSNSRVWTNQTFDLMPFAGQTVLVYFNVYNNGWGYGRTWMYVDDVSVQACR